MKLQVEPRDVNVEAGGLPYEVRLTEQDILKTMFVDYPFAAVEEFAQAGLLPGKVAVDWEEAYAQGFGVFEDEGGVRFEFRSEEAGAEFVKQVAAYLEERKSVFSERKKAKKQRKAAISKAIEDLDNMYWKLHKEQNLSIEALQRAISDLMTELHTLKHVD